MNRVKVGIIGLGEVAQIIHLPILQSLTDRFEIAALCDISPQLLKVLGKKYNVGRLYTDAQQLVEQADLDAVFVLNSDEYHAECAIAAAQNKKHVLIEKPMCLTIRQADEIIKARNTFGVQILVGYMRRYAPAFQQAVQEVKNLDINYARIHDIIGENRLMIEQSSVVHRFDDIPDENKKDRADRAGKMVTEALGDVPQILKNVYRQLCGLSSHDISAMREIIGIPKRVKSAAQWNNGRFINAIFEYDGYYVTFETGVDHQRRFDAHIEVYGEKKTLKVNYDTPYIRHLPTTLTVTETVGDSYNESVVRPTFEDPYTHEIKHFYEVITKGIKPKTPPEDFKEDLKIFNQMIEALKDKETVNL